MTSIIPAPAVMVAEAAERCNLPTQSQRRVPAEDTLG